MATTTVKISQLTLGVAATDVVVPGSLADGSATRRFTLGSVVGLAHTHAITQVSGLQAELDGKASVAATNVSRVVSLNDITGAVSIVAGSNVTVSPSGSSITIAASGGGGSENVVTSVSITASADDYTLPEADIYRLDNPTTNTITLSGLATATAFSPKLLVNVSTGSSSTLTLLHQNTNSTAVNRLVNSQGTDYAIAPDAAALVMYDSTTERWRIL
jgi:hypothetical protein